MSNIITIELCAEDRARLDRLAQAFEARTAQVENILAEKAITLQTPSTEPDPIQQKLAETLAKAETPAEPPKKATEATTVETLPTEHPADEDLPWPEETQPEPTVTLEQIQQKVMQLAAGNGGAKKAKVRAIINTYGTKVSDLKDQPDKWTEVWKKLTALESEG